MRSKFVGVILFLLCVAVSAGSPAFALPSDGDLNAAQLVGEFPYHLAFGGTGDYVIDRNLEAEEDLEAVWYGGNINYDPVDQVHFNIFLGGASLRLGNVQLDTDVNTRTYLVSNDGFAAGVGAKWDFWEFSIIPDQPNMQVYTSGGWRFTDVEIESSRGDPTPVALDIDVTVHEWQAGVGVSQRINDPFGIIGLPGVHLVPYVGVAYSDINVDLDGSSLYPQASTSANQAIVLGNRDSSEKVAAVAGVQILSFSDRFSVGIEGRFIAETAGSVTGRVRW